MRVLRALAPLLAGARGYALTAATLTSREPGDFSKDLQQLLLKFLPLCPESGGPAEEKPDLCPRIRHTADVGVSKRLACSPTTSKSA